MKTLLLLFLILSGLSGYSQQSVTTQIDARARKHYSEAQISQMNPLMIAQINFIYSQSFVINTDKPCPECPALKLDQIDVATLNRKKTTRARVYQTVPGHPIDLLSYDELDAELQRIAAEFNATQTQH